MNQTSVSTFGAREGDAKFGPGSSDQSSGQGLNTLSFYQKLKLSKGGKPRAQKSNGSLLNSFGVVGNGSFGVFQHENKLAKDSGLDNLSMSLNNSSQLFANSSVFAKKVGLGSMATFEANEVG